ncbi:uncharacterized protein LOC126842518 [Adelges cooleyi]|uniref:uncharacterized protein LOC126842518 n=1 Tax=Adelges cooleyi TaxID=133065 RepID=UPI00217FFF11|nr:uncharacterized protein LOC126842518 [Adelges cooleyi]
MLASFFHWNSPTFHNVTYPRTAYISAWILASITALIILSTAVWTFMKAVSHERTASAFEPSSRWVPDLTYSLETNMLDSMTGKREDVMLANYDNLIFGIGKPILTMRLDQSVQTGSNSDTELKTYYNTLLFTATRKYFLASITDCGSSAFDALKSKWCADSGIMIACTVLEMSCNTPPLDQGSNRPLLKRDKEI